MKDYEALSKGIERMMEIAGFTIMDLGLFILFLI